jgi:hypothetical protein
MYHEFIWEQVQKQQKHFSYNFCIIPFILRKEPTPTRYVFTKEKAMPIQLSGSFLAWNHKQAPYIANKIIISFYAFKAFFWK